MKPKMYELQNQQTTNSTECKLHKFIFVLAGTCGKCPCCQQKLMLSFCIPVCQQKLILSLYG